MRDVRVQYFLNYAMLGAVLPYASIFFAHAGLDATHIGYAWAIYGAALVLSPVVMTWAADAHADPRRLTALALVVSGASLLGLGFVHGVWPILGVWAVYCAASLPLMPLQDGICFALQRRQQERGGRVLPYHRTRVWGTIGYIAPSLLLFALLYQGMPVKGAVVSGAVFAALAAVQALLLDNPRPPGRPTQAGSADEADRPRAQLPTAAAARALLRPRLLPFVAAVFLAQMAGTIYSGFYPLYLTLSVGMPERWVGLVSNTGTVVEIFFVLAAGRMTRLLGVRGLLAAGLLLTGLRMTLLGASASVAVAVGTQIFHGLQVVALWVIPQMFIDRQADDRWRHSMQGVFVMLMACGRVIGSLVAGPVAGHSLSAVFVLAAGMCAAGAAVTLVAFREHGAAAPGDAALEPPAGDPAATAELPFTAPAAPSPAPRTSPGP